MEAARKQQDASARGTAVHGLVEDYIKGRLDYESADDSIVFGLHGYLKFEDKYEPTDVESEVFLRSEEYGYAGTADIICRLDGQLWVLDLKTSGAFHSSFGLQLRAYEQALFETRGEHARMGVIQLTDKIKACYRFKEYDEPLGVFAACRTLYAWTIKDRKGTNFDGRFIT